MVVVDISMRTIGLGIWLAVLVTTVVLIASADRSESLCKKWYNMVTNATMFVQAASVFVMFSVATVCPLSQVSSWCATAFLFIMNGMATGVYVTIFVALCVHPEIYAQHVKKCASASESVRFVALNHLVHVQPVVFVWLYVVLDTRYLRRRFRVAGGWWWWAWLLSPLVCIKVMWVMFAAWPQLEHRVWRCYAPNKVWTTLSVVALVCVFVGSGLLLNGLLVWVLSDDDNGGGDERYCTVEQEEETGQAMNGLLPVGRVGTVEGGQRKRGSRCAAASWDLAL